MISSLTLRLSRIFNARQTPAQRAFALTLGVVFGLTPLLAPHNVAIFVIYLLFRINGIAFSSGWIIAEAVALTLFSVLEGVGLHLLSLPSLRLFWTEAYNSALWRFFEFNDALILGSVIVALAIAPLIFAVSWAVLRFYKEQFLARFLALSTVKKIQQSKAAFLIQIITKPAVDSSSPSWLSKGGSITLAAILLCAGGGYWLLNSIYIKNQLENTFSQWWGAPVAIEALHFSLSPITLSLHNVHVADPNNRYQNRVEFDNLKVTLSMYHRVVGRWVLEDLALTNVRLDVPRKTPYALQQAPADSAHTVEQSVSEITASQGGIADIVPASIDFDIIWEVASSNTRTRQKAMHVAVKAAQDAFAPIEKGLPSILQSHEQALGALLQSSGSVQQIGEQLTQWNTVQQNITQDMERLRVWGEQADIQIDLATQAILKLETGVDDDIRQGLQLISQQPRSSSELMATIYGAQAQHNFDQLQRWYVQSAPFIERIKAWLSAYTSKQNTHQSSLLFSGEHVAFEEADPQPVFNIKRLVLSVDYEDAQWRIAGNNIHFNHASSGQFSTLKLQSDDAIPIVIEGVVDYRKAGNGFSQWRFGQELHTEKDKKLVDNAGFSLHIAQANTLLGGSIKLEENGNVQGNLQRSYEAVQWDTASYRERPDIGQYMVPLLADISEFLIDVSIDGSLLAPKVGVSSSMERHLDNVFKRIRTKSAKQTEQRLRQKMQAFVQTEKEKISTDFINLKASKQRLDRSQIVLQKLLAQGEKQFLDNRLNREKERINQQKEQQEEQLKKDIQNTIKSRFPKIKGLP